MSMPDPRSEAVRAILRLAEDDRRRGVQYWFGDGIADELRDLVREAMSSGSSSRPSPGSSAKGARAAGRLGDVPSSGVSQGVTAASSSRTAPPSVPSSPAASPMGRPERKIVWGPPPEATDRAEDWKERLAGAAARAAACRACGLCQTRRNVVFGKGDARVPLVFVGEAPGAEEDARGLPFVGRAGQLLDRIIEAIGLTWQDVYICNILKCRPPDNRNPAPEEIVHCTPFLAEQLELLKPKVICTLGLFATQFLLKSTEPIGRLRGRLFDYEGAKLLPTYHPAALLRNPGLKAVVWEDVQLLRKILDA